MARINRLVVAAVLTLLSLTAPSFAEDRWLTLPEPPPMPQPLDSGYAKVNGIAMYYAVYGGVGDPVLLVHGGLGNADIWANQVNELAKTHTVIVADSRGHGRTTRDSRPFSYHLMAEDYMALLEQLKIDKVALVGWSDGGNIGLDIAMNHPETLTRLWAQAANATVSGVNPDVGNNPTFGAYIKRAAGDYARLSPTPEQFGTFLGQISQMWTKEPAWTTEQLKAIKVPVTIAIGDHDEAIVPAHTKYLAATIPHARLVVLKDASHFAMLQDPAGYNEALSKFLEGK